MHQKWNMQFTDTGKQINSLLKTIMQTKNYHTSCIGINMVGQCCKSCLWMVLNERNTDEERFRYEDFIKNSDEDSDQDKFLNYTEVSMWVTQRVLPERVKIKKSYKLLCNLFNKEDYVIHIKALKHRLVLQ